MRTIQKTLTFIISIIVIIMLLFYFIFFVVVVPSPSMYPTIKIDDRILTTRIYDFNSIKRGDILVFYSEELKETMIKRVIGLPHDLVEIDSNGDVSINNQKLNEPYVKYPDNQLGNFKVPEGEYFFLGDARNHSYDSRDWKYPFIPKENIKGKAKLIIFPFERLFALK